MAIAPNAAPIAQRPVDRLSQADPHILGRVVSIDVQVARAADRQVHQGMTSEQLKHVIQETRSPLADLHLALAIQVEPQSDLGLTRLSLDLGNTAQGLLKVGAPRGLAENKQRALTDCPLLALEPMQE